MKDANVQFCKAFWQLTETDIVQMGSNIITPNVAVNTLHRVPFSSSLTLPTTANKFTTIDPPESSTPKDHVQIRVLSHELREGMQHLDELKAYESGQLFNNILSLQSNVSRAAKSANLILHIHGGGFIAHSSKSHEIYLKPWCKELKVNIFLFYRNVFIIVILFCRLLFFHLFIFVFYLYFSLIYRQILANPFWFISILAETLYHFSYY